MGGKAGSNGVAEEGWRLGALLAASMGRVEARLAAMAGPG